jgi:hypothetical protein
VGSTFVDTGDHPAVFDAQLPGTVTYNAALRAAVPQLIEPWTLNVVIPRLHPKVLVIGVSSFDFFDSPASKIFYRAFADSFGGRKAIGDDDLLYGADRWLRDHSSLWAQRFDHRHPDTILDALRGEDPPADERLEIEANGHTKYNGPDAFNPRPEAGPAVGNWSIGTDNLGALRRVIERAHAEGIKVALVDMPITDEYVAKHPHGEDDYATFRSHLHELGTETGTVVLDFDQIRDHAMFADLVHLNTPGSQTFTPELVSALQASGVLDGL